jgi:hypothetical protein
MTETSSPNPILTITVLESFDGNTETAESDKLTRQASGQAGWKLTTSAIATNIETLGVVTLGDLLKKSGGSLINGTACRVPYVQYASGNSTEFSVQVGQKIGAVIEAVGPTRTINPDTAASPVTLLGFALPSLDHCLLLRSNGTNGESINISLQSVPPSTDFSPDFAPVETSAAIQPFVEEPIIATGSTMLADTWQAYDATAGAMGIKMPGTVLWTFDLNKNTYAGLWEVGGSTNVVTLDAGDFADLIQDPDTRAFGATATLNIAHLAVNYRLTTVGSDIVWALVAKN